MTGRFITIEGIDGSGKTTQARLLKEWLEARGHSVLFTREPGGSKLGNQIREILLNPENGEMTDRAELFLYLADRSQHVEEVIKPALAQGQLVISERYADSTTAYQSGGREIHPEIVALLNRFATDSLLPDLTLVLDLDPKPALSRRSQKWGSPDRLESQSLKFHQRVAAGYRELARREPDRVKLIDASPDEQTVHEKIIALVEDFLAETGRKGAER